MSHSLRACAGRGHVQQRVRERARMAALCLEGLDRRTVALTTERHPATVTRWVCRHEEGALFTDRPRSGRPRRFSEAARLATIAVYCQRTPPLPGLHGWSLRDAEAYFKERPGLLGAPISRSTIQRILLEHALRPHRRRYYLQITDPEFFPKMERIVKLYLEPPKHLFCFDECTCIQALKRKTPDLPAIPGRPLYQDFDYIRGGTTDLMAFLNPSTGQVFGACTPKHDRHTLIDVFTKHVATLPSGAALHYVMDNLSTHYHEDFCRRVADLSNVSYPTLKTGRQRRAWLASDHKRIVVHFLPFHASWLNMVEIWFGILKRKCLSYGHFRSVEELTRDITAFIETWNVAFAHPFTWTYTGEGLHGKAVRRFTRLLSIETESAISNRQMDCGFLRNQLLLMSDIAENYIDLIPNEDWFELLHHASEKNRYITTIIEEERGPRRKKTAQAAYDRFRDTVFNPEASPALAA